MPESSSLSLPPCLNPCQNVRRTCRAIVRQQQQHGNSPSSTTNNNSPPPAHGSVTIHTGDAMTHLIHTMLQTHQSQDVTWDAEGWHYTGSKLAMVQRQPAAEEDIPNSSSSSRCNDNNNDDDDDDSHTLDELRIERVFLYVLALDAINFCFWPKDDDGEGDPESTRTTTNTLEYDHLAVALTKLAEESDKDDGTTRRGEEDDYFFDPSHLATLTLTEMKNALEPLLRPHVLPNLQERCRLWNEVGAVLVSKFPKGRCCRTLLEECDYAAPQMVQWLVSHIPGFRDEAVWSSSSATSSRSSSSTSTTSTTTTTSAAAETSTTLWVAFYKRAQIFVGDLQAALQTFTSIQIRDMDELTTFADYRVPQLLRHYGVLEYSPALSEMVDTHQELPAGSKYELSIRAATVVAVEELVERYNEHLATRSAGGASGDCERMTSVTMDWHLWQVGEKMNQQGQLKPHHRVRTIYY